MQWVRDISAFLEPLYYLASIGLVATVIIGIKQMDLLKKDIATRNKRASVEKSIEYLNWFATAFIPEMEKYTNGAHAASVGFFEGPFNKNFIFDEQCKLEIHDIGRQAAYSYNTAISLLNQLEFFGAAMTSGLADEELAFNPLAITYCQFVERLYVPMCTVREDSESTMYSNTIKLYNIWKDRIKKNDLEKKKRKIESDMSGILDRRIESIGT